jgi:aspartate dehydrogenase
MDVAIIGLGQVGLDVARGIIAGRAGDARLVAALVRRVERVDPEIRSQVNVTDDIDAFLAVPHSLVVELGGHQALRDLGPKVLASGRDLLTIDSGALADDGLLESLRSAAVASGRQILIPSGAIAGIDAIAAAALGGLDSVTHTTRKPVAAFTAEQLGGPPPTEARLLFDGPAKEGVLKYPENVNVAASVSLAGIGLERTRLRVYVDPSVIRNQHEVVAEGYFGRLRIEIENIPTEHAKTGRIVALSVLKAIRDLTAPIVMGR